MKKADATREKLLMQARRQMWARGYGAVSLREIATAAGVDVALISRHFGSKLGLFEASIEGAFSLIETAPQDERELVEQFIRLYAETPRTSSEPSAFRMLLTNAHDEEVGEMVRGLYDRSVQALLRDLLGAERAALFAAVLFGISLVEKALLVDGIADPKSETYRAQLRHMMDAALGYGE